jgi:hypothetical protein
MKSLLAICFGLVVVACSPGSSPSPSAAASESFGPRPSSPATLTITAPQNGATITGSSVHVTMSLANATITSVTTASISPTLGHIHLYVDGVLTSMNYSTEEDLPVTPGTYALKAEFVASDHAPFNPRVWSNQVVFTVS